MDLTRKYYSQISRLRIRNADHRQVRHTGLGNLCFSAFSSISDVEIWIGYMDFNFDINIV
jgi:hypothetical protein